MVNQCAEAQTWSARRPFQYFEISIGTAKGEDWPPANSVQDGERLASFVIHKSQFALANEAERAVMQFVAHLDRTANDLLGRNRINRLRPRSDKFCAFTGFW